MVQHRASWPECFRAQQFPWVAGGASERVKLENQFTLHKVIPLNALKCERQIFFTLQYHYWLLCFSVCSLLQTDPSECIAEFCSVIPTDLGGTVLLYYYYCLNNKFISHLSYAEASLSFVSPRVRPHCVSPMRTSFHHTRLYRITISCTHPKCSNTMYVLMPKQLPMAACWPIPQA